MNVLFIVKLKDKGYAAETFGAEAGTYRINWKDGKRGVTFDYEGGDDMHFDDTWTDLFWDASNPQVTEAPARKKRGLFRGKRVRNLLTQLLSHLNNRKAAWKKP